MSDYMFGQGRVYIGTRDANGAPQKLRWAGDCSKCNISIGVEKKDIKESYSGQRATAATVNTGKSATIAIAMREGTADNLTLALYGKKVSQVAGTVTGESLPAGVAGDLLLLAHQDVSDVVVDVAGTPVSTYRAHEKHGSLELTDVQAASSVDYSYGATMTIAMLASTPANRWVRYEGVNLVDDSPVIADIYNCRFNPLKEFSLIGDDFAAFDMDADVLIDSQKAPDGDDGQFARIIKVTP